MPHAIQGGMLQDKENKSNGEAPAKATVATVEQLMSPLMYESKIKRF